MAAHWGLKANRGESGIATSIAKQWPGVNSREIFEAPRPLSDAAYPKKNTAG